MIDDLLKDAESRMKSGVEALEESLKHVRTGRATPALVDGIEAEYYGMMTRLNQLANISVPEPRQIMIKPFDPKTIDSITKAIQKSDLGINPSNDGKVIRLILPALTEDRRRDLAKLVHHRVEEGRVAVRNVRRDVLKDMRDLEKEKLISEDDLKKGETRLQELTDKYVEMMTDVGDLKEAEIMEV